MIGTILMVTVAIASGADNPATTGALPGWTSTDSVVVQARGLVADGKWADAEKLIAQGPPISEMAAADRASMLEIIKRLRYDYSVSEAALLAKIHHSLPTVTAEELKRWRDAGQVRYRNVDGKIRYFRSEPGNLYRFCPEAKKRLEDAAPQTAPAASAARDGKLLGEHLAAIIAAAEKTGETEVIPVKHQIKFTVTVPAHTAGAKAGSLVRCWLPFPQEYRQQKDVKLISTSPAEHILAPNGVGDTADAKAQTQNHRSGFVGAPQRTVYLEQKIADPAQPVVFAEEFEYTSYAYCPKLADGDVRPLPPDFDRTYLAERPPHIVFTPEIKALAQKLVGDETNPLAKARKIFNYLDQTVFWGPEEEYAIIPSFCMQALTRKQGDCGLQSTLFVTLCRCVGVPARWQSGFQTKPWSTNMHDWSEIYIEPWGWLPVDMSYGLQVSDNPRIRDFYLGHQDAYRLIVNLDYGRELVPPKSKWSWRSEPADFQRGEVEIDGRNLYFDEWDHDISFEWK